MIFGSYHEKMIGCERCWSDEVNDHQFPASTLSLFHHLFYYTDTLAHTRPRSPLQVPVAHLPVLVTWRAATSLPPLPPLPPSQPLGDNLVLTPILWLVGFDAATAKICGPTPQPSKTLRFHG